MKIVFYTGPAWDKWDGNSIKSHGCGGSEQATMHMANQLAKAGHKLSVYGDPVNEGIYDRVEYLHHSKFHNIDADVLLSSRCPGAVDDCYNNRFNKRILIHHDCHEYATTTKERSDKFDIHFALTNWHKQFLQNYYPFMKNIVVTRNGIDTSLYDQVTTRNPHKLIYSSSPNRGLKEACQIFTEVRKAVPDATLDVFYGWKNWEETLKKKPNPMEMMEMKLIKGIAESTPGVTLHGRVSPSELARHQLSSGVWFYPTAWHETFCIGAIEAQAAGLRTVTSALAALNETANGTKIFGHNETVKYQKEFLSATLRAMDDTEYLYDRDNMMDNAKRFDWQQVAKEWMEIL